MAENSKRLIQINNTRMGLAEYKRNEWIVNAELGTTPEDVLDPQFWAHMASQLSPYDRIEVRIDDGIWMMELLVLGCDRSWARVHLLHHHVLSTMDVSQTQAAKHEVAFKGPQRKWSVIRLSDAAYLKEGLNSRAEAESWRIDYERNMPAS